VSGERTKITSVYSLIVHTDSHFMVGQLTQGWQIRAANLHPGVDKAARPIQTFGRRYPSTSICSTRACRMIRVDVSI
jgi:hypothetical protein